MVDAKESLCDAEWALPPLLHQGDSRDAVEALRRAADFGIIPTVGKGG